MTRIILGSRSLRRLELLSQIFPAEQIEILPPLVEEEAGFSDLTSLLEIKSRLLTIAAHKWDDVCGQVSLCAGLPIPILTADTVVVANVPTGEPVALEKPPDGDDYSETIRRWFRDYYAGKSHLVMTAFVIGFPDSRRVGRVVSTNVTFRADVDRWLEWYIATGEPRGKAGGYALQDRGSVFVTRVEGSYSNVVGLPMEELMQAMSELDISIGNGFDERVE
ncbi:MAG: Maf family protein [Planctomycetota bacterium]|nr:Maf family protein [Planctomycetota bacterium]MDA1212711.1 Maf family protein [Planctomycetota bacterium]